MAQQQGITPRAKQGVQGFLGVNLRRDRVSIADEELAKAVNAELHERPGSILLRRGRRKQFDTALNDLAIRRLALVNGVRYQIAGQSVYRDASVILSGGLSTRLFTTMQAFRSLTDSTTWVFIADRGTGAMLKDDGTRLVPWGIAEPPAPVCAVGGVGTGLTGDYLGGYSYIRYDDEVIAHESNVSADDAVTLANNRLAIGDIIDPTDAQVNGIGLYRSVAGGVLLLLDARERIPTESTTFSVTHGWEVTASPGGVAADGLILHWSVDKGTTRGTQAWEPEAAPGLRLMGSASVIGESVTLPTHDTGDLLVMFAYRSGSNGAPAVPAGWTTWGTGSGADLNASVGGYKVATSDVETSGAWTAATGLICHVYRGQRVAGAIGAAGDNGGSGTTVTYPALNLTDTAGTSLVVAFGGNRSINTTMEKPPSGTVLREHQTGINFTEGEVAGFDTDTGASVWLARTVVVGGSPSGWRARSLEIRAEPTTTSTDGESEDPNGVRGTHLWESVLTIPVSYVGPELITNGTFDTDVTGWTDKSLTGGFFVHDAVGHAAVTVNTALGSGPGWGQQAIATSPGTTYTMTFDLLHFGFSAIHDAVVRIGSTDGGTEIVAGQVFTTPSTGNVLSFIASGTTTYLGFRDETSATTGYFRLDNVSCRETTSGTPTIPVTTQTLRWAYPSFIADSALGAEGPTENDVPPSAEWVTEYQGHAFLARLAQQERLAWSGRFAPEAFSPDDYLDIGTPDDPIQCALQVGGLLGVFTRSTKYRVTGNATSGFTYQEALSHRGTESPLAVIACEYGIVFPHHDGIFSTNLISLDQELSGDIAPLFYDETVNDMPPINWAASNTFAGAYRKGRYYFAYASGEASQPNTLAVLSKTTGKWYFFDHPARSLYVEQGDDEVLTAGFTDGFVYVLDDGTSDAGSDITLDAETKDYFGAEPDVRKLHVFARVDAEVPSGETLSVGMYVDGVLRRTASVTGTRRRVLLPFPAAAMGYTWRLRFTYTGQERVRIHGASVITLPLETS